MVSQNLIQSVRSILEKSEKELGIREIEAQLQENHESYDVSEVREAIWVLIDQGEVDLTPDRKLVLKQVA
jgi:hypothetical protein